MARFRLLRPHVLNIEGAEYELKLVTNWGGKNANEKWNCHRLLEPESPLDCNYKKWEGDPGDGAAEGEAVIIINTKPFKLDYVLRPGFVPTSEMKPLDAEAEALIEAAKVAQAKVKGSITPAESLDHLPLKVGQDPIEAMLEAIREQTEALKIFVRSGGGQAVVMPQPVAPDVLAGLLSRVEAMEAENKVMKAQLAQYE